MEPSTDQKRNLENSMNPDLKEILDPNHCAVLVIDVQGAYCDPTETLPTLIDSDTDDLQKLIPKIENFIEKARKAGIPIIWTKMIENSKHMPENLKRKMEINNTPPLSTPETPGFELLLRPEEGDEQIVKNHYNAFTGTDLDNILRGKGVKTVILIGGYTSRCVAATALMASDHLGYDVIVPEDLVGVPRRYINEHMSALSVINSILGYVLLSSQITSVWD